MIPCFLDNVGYPVAHHLRQYYRQIEYAHKQSHFSRIHPFAHYGKHDGYNSRPTDTYQKHADIKVKFNLAEISDIEVSDGRERQSSNIGFYPTDMFCNRL